MTTTTDYGPVVASMVALIADEVRTGADRLCSDRAHAGEALPDSDVDLLVVMPDGTDETRATIAMHALLHTMPLPKDIVVSTPSAIALPRAYQG